MKLTTLLLVIALLQVSAKSFSQVTVSETNVPAETVMKAIEKQTGYVFIYDEAKVKLGLVTVDLHNASITETLNQLLKNLPITYQIIKKNIVLQPKTETPPKRETTPAANQPISVKGQVVDETGQPKPGVNVREKGTQNGTTTDDKGYFTLTVSNNDAIVTFSYIGYETKELTPKDLPANVTITLKAAENNLREVVISKGYYNERQELSTGDVTVVGAKILSDQPGVDPIAALEGHVPGLYISQSSGLPGANETVMLRGQNSIFNGNVPLYIIDGVPFSSTTLTPPQVGGGALTTGISPFSALNLDDIENIEVLKDADATAIYGSRGANGVIIITTKKGKAGNTKVDVDLSQGIGQVAHFMDMMNTQQYLQMRHQAFALDGLTPDPNYDFDINGVWDTTRNTNWQKVLIGNTAHYTNAQVAISGGSENTQFYVGGGFTRQTTVFPGDFDDAKGSLNFNLTHSSADKRFTLQLSASYVNDYNNIPQNDLTPTALTLAPDAPPLYNPNGSLNYQVYNGSGTFSNPLAPNLESANAVTNNLIGRMVFSYRILPGLILSSSMGYNDDRLNQTNITPSTSIEPPANTIAANRSNNFGNSESQTWLIEPQLSYDRKISKGKLSALIGSTFQQSTSFSTGYVTSGYNNDALISNPANATTFKFNGENYTLYRYNAIYARLNYTWEDKYLLNITARRDGSSRFGPGRQWGNFGAAGAGWIFSKEKFAMDNLPWLSFGKLRGSYGITGNDQIPDYQFLSTYTTNTSTYQGTTGLAPTLISNPYLQWEVNKKLETGIELGFLKDRINFTADYFRNRSGNQLVRYPLPTQDGFVSIQENLPAVVQNTGAEFTLNTINVQSGSFKWSTSINLTIPSNKLVSYPGLAQSTYSNVYEIGQSLFIKHTYTGVIVNPADGVYEVDSPTGKTENPVFSDKQFTTPVTQKWYGGFGNSFSYKGLQLDVFFEIVKQTGYNYWQSSNPGLGGYFDGFYGQNQPVAIIGNTWQKPGDVTKYGVLSTFEASDPNGLLSNGNTNFGIGDASFIRLKNASLSWSLPKNWQRAMRLQNTRIYVRGENLLTFSHYFGLDPQTQGLGLPPLRVITMGIHTSL